MVGRVCPPMFIFVSPEYLDCPVSLSILYILCNTARVPNGRTYATH